MQWDSPQRPRIEPRHEKMTLDALVGFCVPSRPLGHQAHSPTPAGQLTRGGNGCLVFVNLVFQQGSEPLDESPRLFDACRLAAGSGTWHDARPFELGRRSGSASAGTRAGLNASCPLEGAPAVRISAGPGLDGGRQQREAIGSERGDARGLGGFLIFASSPPVRTPPGMSLNIGGRGARANLCWRRQSYQEPRGGRGGGKPHLFGLLVDLLKNALVYRRLMREVLDGGSFQAGRRAGLFG